MASLARTRIRRPCGPPALRRAEARARNSLALIPKAPRLSASQNDPASKVKGLTLAGGAAGIWPRGGLQWRRDGYSQHAWRRHPKPRASRETRLVTAGRDTKAQHGFVNPPVYHASTVLYPTAEDQVAHRARYQYGRRGTPTSEALESALRELEGAGCAGVALLPSGLAAISTALLAVAGRRPHPGHRQRLSPTRNFCDGDVQAHGRRNHLLRSADRRRHRRSCCKPNTRAVFVEAPGSQSFEMQDIPAIAEVAHDKGALVLMDNTWATPLYFRAFDKGVDLVDPGRHQIYRRPFRRHVRLRLGQCARRCRSSRTTMDMLGLCVGPDDMYLALRGLRTLGVRLARHYQSGLQVARWLEQPAGSGARAASGAGERSRPRHLEARLHRRLRPVQRRAQAGSRAGGLRLHGRARAVRHGLFLGRLREPGDSVRLRRLSHRDAHGRRAGRRCASTSGWKIRAT